MDTDPEYVGPMYRGRVEELTFEERLRLLVDRETAERESKRLLTRLKYANLVDRRPILTHPSTRDSAKPSGAPRLQARRCVVTT